MISIHTPEHTLDLGHWMTAEPEGGALHVEVDDHVDGE